MKSKAAQKSVVNYDEYIREKMGLDEEFAHRTCIKEIGKAIWFVNTGGNVIWMSVNVAGTGNMKPRIAARFADCIKEAAELADNFKYNGYVIR